MVLRLDDLIEMGEINCTRHYSIFGFIKLRGHETPLYLQLTGNPDPDLRGKRFRFEPREFPSGSNTNPPVDFAQIAREQIGPPGDFTAARKVCVFDCSAEDFHRRGPAGEGVATVWKRCLYLEWFSQNGRVVVELADPLLEFLDIDDLGSETETVEVPDESGGMSPSSDEEEPSWSNDSSAREESAREERAGEESAGEECDSAAEGEEDDPYGLLPDGLQQHLDAQASATDRQFRGDAETGPRDLVEAELMHDLIERGEGEPLASILEDLSELPPHDTLNDTQVEAALKALLSKMALFGIALDVCEHFTPRDAYRYLMETILPKETGHRELRHTQWVQHFSTWEDCAQCAVEFERRWEAREGRDQSSDDSSEDRPEE